MTLRPNVFAIRLALSLVVVAAGVGVVAPSAARAEDAVQKIIQLNRKALEDYDILEFEAAKKALLEAINTAKKGNVENHPVVARTYVHLGIVYINGFKDRFKGFQQFQKALAIQGDIKLDKNLSTGELSEVFDSARDDLKSKGGLGPTGKAAAAKPGGKSKAGADDEDEEDMAAAPSKAKTPPKAPPPKPPVVAGKGGGGDEDEDEEEAPKKKAPAKKERKKVEIEEPDLPARIDALDCPNADEAPPKKDIALRCAVNPGLGVTKVFLFYRPPGQEDMIPVPMVQSKKGWWNGVIPGDVVTGKSLQFFFEGRSGAKAVVSNGRSDSPNLMLIIEGAPPVGSSASATAILEQQKTESVDLSDTIEENPLEAKSNAGPKLQLGITKKEETKVKREIGDRTFFVGLVAGSGLGFSFGGPNGVPEYRTEFTDNKAGILPATLGHAGVEVGYYVNPNLVVSVQSRHQYIPQPKLSGAATGAHAAMARLLYFLGDHKKRSRMFASVMAGGGEGFRLVIHPDESNPNFKDTVRGGPFIGGVGFGYTYDFSPLWAFVGEGNVLVGAPKLAGDLDLHVGMQLVF